MYVVLQHLFVIIPPPARDTIQNDGDEVESELGSLGDIVDVDAMSDSPAPLILLEEDFGHYIQD